ncbi:MAG: phosphoribosylformylglycinamidine cyclo-ligase [Planctomycetota bacterium]
MSGSSYTETGVDTDLAASAAASLGSILAATASFPDDAGQPMVENGYYASALRLTDELALAVCTDGVGSKLLVAEAMGKYDTVGIDCIAMNVNDLICIGAKPITMVDYVGVEHLDAEVMAAVGRGLVEGARQSSISIPGGETAQLPEMIRGHQPGKGLDLVGTAVGVLPVDRVNCGKDVAPGDVVLGLASSGLHSNGYTLARHALLEKGGLDLAAHHETLGRTVGEEMLEPTRIYVKEAMALWESDVPVKAMLHITGDGLLNLTRVKSKVGWCLDTLPEPPAVFRLVQELGAVDIAEMYRVFNMGIGFCVVVAPQHVEAAQTVLQTAGSESTVIGRAVAEPPETVQLPQHGLTGTGTAFQASSSG